MEDKIHWSKSFPFVLIHVIAVVGLFYFPLTWSAVAWVVGLYYVRMWAVTTAYHRYFSHRSFKTSRAFQFFMALMGSITLQKGVLYWAVHHRHHHRASDTPDDVHSPVQRGFWWAHVGWILAKKYETANYENIRDFTKYPELVWLNQYWIVPTVAFAAIPYLIGGWDAFFWGFIVSSVLLWHGTFTVNSLAHVWGSRRYETSDQSRNNLWIALITMGEGWHNNHHHYMSSARQGFFWWEIDCSYYILLALEKLGIVWDVRVPPAHVLGEEPRSMSTMSSEAR